MLLYQTLIGAWPVSEADAPHFKERLKGYLVKAAREAKSHTNWIAPDLEYESCLVSFAGSILEDSSENRFLNDFANFQRRVAFYGALNSLSQTLLKIVSPGIPDFNQGTELWDLSMVDPDNRRPVDFEIRMGLLANLKEKALAAKHRNLRAMLNRWEDGRVKLYLINKALALRRGMPELFLEGEYIPLLVLLC